MILLSGLKLVPDPQANMPKVFAAIVVFRVIYFLLPLLLSAILVAWHEYALRRNWIRPVVFNAEVPSSNGQPQIPNEKAEAKK
jgi:hypothetical protein